MFDAMEGTSVLQVSVLGKLDVLYQGARIPLPASRKTRALLAYLAVTARPHGRERLCALFWPLPDDPRAALRWSLTRLRPLVEASDCRMILADRETVGLDRERVTVDILSLRKLARNGMSFISTEALLESTVALESDFLEGLELPDCAEFQSWCTGERDETRRLRVQLLTELVSRLADAPEEALRYARALSFLEPANEGAQATLVRLLRAAGRQREAEQEYRRTRQQLEEFDVLLTGALCQAAQLPLQIDMRRPAGDNIARHPHPDRLVAAGLSPNLTEEHSRPASWPPSRPAIAVLPFVNMSGEPEQDYFSDGISEDIIIAISKLRCFLVISRNSSFVYKGKLMPMKQIAGELGVRYLVEGTVRKSGNRVRITAQLNDAVTGAQIWAERYDRDLTDVFAVQDEVTEAIVAGIEPQVHAAENVRPRLTVPPRLQLRA